MRAVKTTLTHLISTTSLMAGLTGLLSLSACTPEYTKPNPIGAIALEETEGCYKGPVEQFGRYIGDWQIEDWQLSREDGKTWTPQQGARWIFSCLGDGVAVQDFWYPNAGGASPSNMGTNLRIYDPKTKRWEITWTAKGAPGLTHIQAKEDADGNIVMTYVSPEQNPPRRIIFYRPTEDGWDWMMEMSQDGGDTWIGVYKIKASPFSHETE